MVKGKSSSDQNLNRLKLSYAIHLAKGRPEGDIDAEKWEEVNRLYENLISGWNSSEASNER